MHHFISIYFNNKLLHVSSRLAAHHQEDQLYINSNWWYSHVLCGLAAVEFQSEDLKIFCVNLQNVFAYTFWRPKLREPWVD